MSTGVAMMTASTVGIGEHALEPGGHPRAGMTPAILAQALGVEVADPPDSGVEVVAEHPQQVRPPIPEADDRHANLVGRGSEAPDRLI